MNEQTVEGGQWDELSLIEASLRKPDAVLEPTVFEDIVKAIAAGGRPEQLVEALSDGYVGYPQMVNVVCGWMKIMDKGETSHAESNVEGELNNSFYFLKELVKQKFSAEKLASIFTQYGGKPPPWLETLVNDARGRKLIYELSATHRNCLLLDYGIQRILRMGHEDEVAQVGSSLASYFSVFHRLLTTRLRAMALSFLPSSSEPSDQPTKIEKKLTSLTLELIETCGKSAHTYFLAQLLLSNLGNHPRYGSIFKRASQDLEEATGRDQASVWLSMSLFSAPGLTMKASAALHEVGEIIASGSATPSRLEHLLLMYQGSPDNLGPIQHPRFTSILISTIFTPASKANSQISSHQSNAIHLLAIASTRRDKSMTPADNNQHQADRRLNLTKDSLQSALALLVRIQGGKIVNEDVVLFNRISKIPLVCFGFFFYWKLMLGQREFFQLSGANSAALVCSRLLVAIATRKSAGAQRFFLPALEVIDVALMALGSQFQDLTKVFLDACIVILREGGSEAFASIQRVLDKWSKDADPSLARHLVIQILSQLGPPYSSPFATWMLNMIHVSGIKKRGGHLGPGVGAGRGSTTNLLQDFAIDCQSIRFDPPLAPRDSMLLGELKVGGSGQSIGIK